MDGTVQKSTGYIVSNIMKPELATKFKLIGTSKTVTCTFVSDELSVFDIYKIVDSVRQSFFHDAKDKVVKREYKSRREMKSYKLHYY
ncbi:hypothetical protein EWB00_010090 [Schistosoma japonicum]|uniref:Uncharacterized protein n=1 Tax=Schistosoma japonicum TaxID=6182 RepID=A0A4Z2DQC6_SCHJA|nr:hypothetical protein EWB00_010090 [Schistosoma japonicum]